MSGVSDYAFLTLDFTGTNDDDGSMPRIEAIGGSPVPFSDIEVS